MWLINVTTRQLEFFNDANDASYVVLSHTWGADEVTFEDMKDLNLVTKKAGWHKIQKTCQLARENGYRFAWVDTCCIDKSSSAELSEAINSMFSWYRKSALCLAYLADVHVTPKGSTSDCALDNGTTKEELEVCRWFTRGWTLQELIAPGNIQFYDVNWAFIASKSHIRSEISQITGIDISVLENVDMLADIPVGRKMAWASQRQTTRIEDIAYCLLGIFGITMPPLYGEGHRAFVRLQEEIARNSNDLTLFAWEQDDARDFKYREIFAHSPLEFRNWMHLRAQPPRFDAENEFTLTNRGLRIAKNLAYWPRGYSNRRASVDEHLLLGLDCLECSQRTQNRPSWVAITLERFGSTYVRSSPGRLEYFPTRTPWLRSSEAGQKSQDIVAYIARSLSPKDMANLQSKAIISICFRPGIKPGGKKYYTRDIKGTEYTEIFEIIAPRNFLSCMPFPERLWQATHIARPAVVFGFQGPSNELWVMPYLENELQEDARPGEDSRSQNSYSNRWSIVRDYVFEKFSYSSGLLAKPQMPTFVSFRDPSYTSWLHRFSVSTEAGLEAPSSTHILQTNESIGSFTIVFTHTIEYSAVENSLDAST
jgi:hypothetical protein